MKKIATILLASATLATACSSQPASDATHPEVEKTSKKNIGNRLSLYPTPLAVVGAWVDGRVNWLLVGHVGIIGHDRLLVSMSQSHYTNAGIKASGLLSINLVDERLLPKADYVGSVSGAAVDKSHTFAFHVGDEGAPIIDASPLVMECRVEDNYQTEGFDNFILSVANTYADPTILDTAGRIDYNVLKPILFEFPTYSYLRTGDVVGKCLHLDAAAAPKVCAKLPQTEKSIVRLARLQIRPEYLEAYRVASAAVGDTSLRTEPGVLTMYAVAEQNDPCRITILETYADEAAYREHLQSPHFKKYKEETQKMIESLDLVVTTPLNTGIQLRSVGI